MMVEKPRIENTHKNQIKDKENIEEAHCCRAGRLWFHREAVMLETGAYDHDENRLVSNKHHVFLT